MNEMPDLSRIIIIICGKLDVVAMIFQTKVAVSISDIGIEVIAKVFCGGLGGAEVNITKYCSSKLFSTAYIKAVLVVIIMSPLNNYICLCGIGHVSFQFFNKCNMNRSH